MSGKLERQKLHDIAFARDQNNRLLVTDEAGRPALWRTKYSLPFYMVSKHLVLVRTKQLPNACLGERHHRRYAAIFKRKAWLQA